jgi:hypothetical protein
VEKRTSGKRAWSFADTMKLDVVRRALGLAVSEEAPAGARTTDTDRTF